MSLVRTRVFREYYSYPRWYTIDDIPRDISAVTPAPHEIVSALPSARYLPYRYGKQIATSRSNRNKLCTVSFVRYFAPPLGSIRLRQDLHGALSPIGSKFSRSPSDGLISRQRHTLLEQMFRSFAQYRGITAQAHFTAHGSRIATRRMKMDIPEHFAQKHCEITNFNITSKQQLFKLSEE